MKIRVCGRSHTDPARCIDRVAGWQKRHPATIFPQLRPVLSLSKGSGQRLDWRGRNIGPATIKKTER